MSRFESFEIDDPIQTEGGQDKIIISDVEGVNLLEAILGQMKIMNMYLSLLTDTDLDGMEIE